jgi:hypothetical protein
MAKIYRTANGKKVDMGALLLRNEEVRAVGNMGVNAKGDLINDKNTKLVARNEQVNKQYRKQIRNQVVDTPATDPVIKRQEPEKIEGLDEPIINEEIVTESPSEKKPAGGLASAIAKARQVEQSKLKTPREEARDETGVKKI